MTREEHKAEIKSAIDRMNRALMNACFDGFTVEIDSMEYSKRSGHYCPVLTAYMKDEIE